MGTDEKDDFDSPSSLNWSNVRNELSASSVDELTANGNFESWKLLSLLFSLWVYSTAAMQRMARMYRL